MYVEDLTETGTIIFRHNASLRSKKACNWTNTQTRQYTRLNIHRTNIGNSNHELPTHGYISDHSLVTIHTNLFKEKYGKKVKIIWDTTRITKENLEANFTLPLFEEIILFSQAYNQEELQEILDRVVPSKTIKVKNNPRKLWFNKYI